MNNKIKAALFDADGVTILPREPFSVQYAKKKGFNVSDLNSFFDHDFPQAKLGKADLKELIEKHQTAWHLTGSTNDILEDWLATTNRPNTELVTLIQELREQGILCYLVTNQEKYLTNFFREVIFSDVFDGIFSSCEIGTMKPSEGFFKVIFDDLAGKKIQPGEIIYFDNSGKNINAANQLGLQAHLYANVDDVRDKIPH